MNIVKGECGIQAADGFDYRKDTLERTGIINMVNTLEFAEVEYENKGVLANVSKWACNKNALINRLRESPDWHEEILSVVKDVKFRFTRPYYDRMEMRDRLLGQLERMLQDKGGDHALTATLLSHYREGYLGYTAGLFTNERISEPGEIEFVKNVLKYPRVQEGMKSSRLLQKIIKSWDDSFLTDPQVSRIYSDWTEYISEAETTYKFVLSLNPADYLLMSYGNTWTSCHIINPDIPGMGGSGGYDGQFRAGTLSYMNDDVSAISYIVDSKVPIEELPLTPKIMRQVIFLKPREPMFFQSRLYPARDGSAQYGLFTDSIKDILSDAFHVEKDNWESNDLPSVQANDSHHYADYRCYSNVCEFHVHQTAQPYHRYNTLFSIGDEPLCLKCGDLSSSSSDTLYCRKCIDETQDDDDDDYDSCTRCGNLVHREESIWVRDEVYCSDCTAECLHCEEYAVVEDMIRTNTGDFVCDACYSNHYGTCDNCSEVFHHEHLNCSPDDNDYYCDSCYDELIRPCENCGEYFYNTELDDGGFCEGCAKDMVEEETEEEAEAKAEAEAACTIGA